MIDRSIDRRRTNRFQIRRHVSVVQFLLLADLSMELSRLFRWIDIIEIDQGRFRIRFICWNDLSDRRRFFSGDVGGNARNEIRQLQSTGTFILKVTRVRITIRSTKCNFYFVVKSVLVVGRRIITRFLLEHIRLNGTILFGEQF